MYPYPNSSILTKGLSFLKNIQWGSILDGTSKTLGVINQAIPVVYQVKPFFHNAKTFLKIANTIAADDTLTTDTKKEEAKTGSSNNSPIFYID